jgi:hypothetical protein
MLCIRIPNYFLHSILLLNLEIYSVKYCTVNTSTFYFPFVSILQMLGKYTQTVVRRGAGKCYLARNQQSSINYLDCGLKKFCSIFRSNTQSGKIGCGIVRSNMLSGKIGCCIVRSNTQSEKKRLQQHLQI